MNIVQKLSLNKHPKDVPDLSLVDAQNIKVSNDESCITNEEGIRENTFIKSFLDNYYSADNYRYEILGIIPCNVELVIIARSNKDVTVASIFRYREKTSTTEEAMKCVYSSLKYHNGKYIGTFTYNVEESLILALSEYDALINVPLKVINLGNFDDDNIENDLHLVDNQLALVPEVKIPSIINYNYLAGSSYKGWYFIFIRYKLNSVDYTQWYNFGTPIYLDNIITKQLVRENFYINGNNSGYNDGFSDAISEDLDICNKTFNIEINTEIFKNDYKNFQLGFICCTKSYTKAWRTNDIDANNNLYTLNNSLLIEHSVTDFISTFYNYFNVKNLITYKNRLYIANYNESYINISDKDLIDNSNNVTISGKINIISNSNIDYITKLPELTNANFNNRCKQTTLIPDGIYNFYIHYIDKYGHATKGYKLNPKSNINNFIDKYAVIIPVIIEDITYYFPCKITDTFGDYWTTRSDSRTVLVYDSFNNGNLGSSKEVSIFEITNALNNIFKDYSNDLYKDLYISQVVNNAIINDDTFSFGITINTNNDYLFRVPKNNSKIINSINYNLQYSIDIQCKNIPEGYVGYYISYEEYEPNSIVTGVLVKRNANVGGYSTVNSAIDDNNRFNEIDGMDRTMCFYSSTFDIQDSIKMKYNALKINSFIFESDDKYKIIVDTSSDLAEQKEKNKRVQYANRANIYYHLSDNDELLNIPIYPIYNYKLGVANDIKTNRTGKGTTLILDDKDELFIQQLSKYIYNDETQGGHWESPETDILTYIVSLYNYRNDIYTSKNKKLIRLTDCIYSENNINIKYGYNGILTYDGVIIYNDNGYVLATSTDDNKGSYKSTTLSEHEQYLPNGIDINRIHPVSYITFPIYDEYFHESKVINNKPKIYYNFVEDPSIENARTWEGSFVEPINSIDLFKNPQGSISDFYPVTNTNYIKDDLNIIQFDKTIRRSNIIQDETRINNWRQFPLEGYKNITENKGKITNIVGIGYLFLVHTEHSLFMFDMGNTLEAVDQSIQLAQPDAFEVAYKEVFTSDLGFGGLQDKEAAIIDQFGYIFYNNDSNRIYQFDNKQLIMIDTDIVEWLLRVKPYNVRFANDKQNNRLLIKMEYGESNTIILSYNYNTKSFISTHTYHFDKAYNTKINLYLRCNNLHNNCSLHQFIKNKNNYCTFDNVQNNLGTIINQPSKISIIINNSFEIVKYLESFNYKLTKVTDVENINKVYSPVEETTVPYSGYLVKVYNDLTNTGELNIEVNEEIAKNIFANFDKPYWYLGVWHYNYLRNKLDTYHINKDTDLLSRIVGNYFIVEFIFNNDDNKLIEFESLNYNISR